MNHKEMMQALLDGRTIKNKTEGCEFHLDPETQTLRSARGIRAGLPITPDDWSIKPRIININGFELPEPERTALKEGTLYYLPLILAATSSSRYWYNTTRNNEYLANGIVHLTSEAAELHAAALLSFTKR